MKVALESGVADLLRNLLVEEGDDAVIRLREAKIGNACKSVIVLRASVDERGDDDVETVLDSIPIVMSEDFADQYGQDYTIYLDEHGMPVVKRAI
jgi:hypothetical protein